MVAIRTSTIFATVLAATLVVADIIPRTKPNPSPLDGVVDKVETIVNGVVKEVDNILGFGECPSGTFACDQNFGGEYVICCLSSAQ